MLSGASSSQARPVGCPFKRVPISMVPILAIAVQRDTAKTLPQEQPRIPRPLAGASASLSGAAPYRSKKYVSELPLHSSNRHSKEHRENFATGATSHPLPFGRYIGIPAEQPVFRARPDGRPFKRVPISMVPIRTIAVQRDTAKTLPQEQPCILPPFGRCIGGPVGRCPLSKRHAPPRAYRPHPDNRRPWNAWKIAAKRCPLFSCIPGFWQGLTNLPSVSLNSPAPDGR